MGELYRLDGNCLDINDLWVDATVTDITIDGCVYLEEDTGTNPRTWNITYEKFHEWQDKNRIAPHSSLADPSHSMWQTLRTAWNETEQSPHSNGKGSLQSYIHSLFTALVYQHISA